MMIIALLVVATIGLSGEGQLWTRYVGAGTVFLFLLLILQQVSNIPTVNEQNKILFDATAPSRIPPAAPDEDDAPSSRSTRN